MIKNTSMSTNQQTSATPDNGRYANAVEVTFDEIIVAQLAKLVKLQEEQYTMLYKMVQADQKDKGAWIDPEEAALILGIRITPSRSHRPRIAWLTRQGFITKFIPGRPPVYDRADVEQCAEKIRQGRIHFPSAILSTASKNLEP